MCESVRCGVCVRSGVCVCVVCGVVESGGCVW